MNMEFNISNVAYIEIIETSDTAAVMRIRSDSNWQCSFLFYWTCFSLFSNKAVINHTTTDCFFILIKI